MNAELIRRYNSKVRPTDTCIFVGDFSFGNSQQTESILKQLNGTKVLVVGNHDKANTINKFDLAVHSMEMQIHGKIVTVKHYPLRWKKYSRIIEKITRWFKRTRDPRYLERMPYNKGQLHIHGHSHSKVKYNENQIHVGVDAWDYYPVSIKELSKYIDSYSSKKVNKE
jgi:calcineurin-like phosphoesterase family protein